MSRAMTKAEETRWQPPRHDFWLAIETTGRKIPRSTRRRYRACVESRVWAASLGIGLYEREAAAECALNFAKERGCLSRGIVQVEDGLWFAFYALERPAHL